MLLLPAAQNRRGGAGPSAGPSPDRARARRGSVFCPGSGGACSGCPAEVLPQLRGGSQARREILRFLRRVVVDYAVRPLNPNSFFLITRFELPHLTLWIVGPVRIEITYT